MEELPRNGADPVAFKLGEFLRELKRRRVYHVGAAYLAIGTAVAFGIPDIFSYFGIPSSAGQTAVILIALGFPIAVILAWIYELSPGGVIKTEPVQSGAPSPPLAPTKPVPPGRSIAVLPFVNMSVDPENEYFSDGISEELLNTLARIPGLKVVARTSSFSFKGRNTPISEIAGSLKVAHVLEGSVRKAGNRVRITAQLISASDGYHVWSDSYDRELEDVLLVQREVAASVGETLKAELRGVWGSSLLEEGRPNTEAYDNYLRARFFFARGMQDDLERAREHFERAGTLDPDLAAAHAGLATLYLYLADAYLAPREAFPKAIQAAEQAIELDHGLAEAHASLGAALAMYAWDWKRAREELETALDLNPNQAEAYFNFALYWIAMNEPEKALECARAAFRLDPVSGFTSCGLEWFLFFAGLFDEVKAQHETTQELSPGVVYNDSVLGLSQVSQGQLEEALKTFGVSEGWLGKPSYGKGVALARLGREDEARRHAESLEAQFQRDYALPDYIAWTWVALGEWNRAYEWIERGLEERSGGVLGIRTVPFLRPLHGQERFLSILEQVGFGGPEA